MWLKLKWCVLFGPYPFHAGLNQKFMIYTTELSAGDGIQYERSQIRYCTVPPYVNTVQNQCAVLCVLSSLKCQWLLTVDSCIQ